MTPLRFSPLGDLVDENGEVIHPSALSTDELIELDRRLMDLWRLQRTARHVIDGEIISRVDAAIDAGEQPEQYTFETDRFKISVMSRKAAMRTDETALRNALMARSAELGLMPMRVQRLFTAKGWKRNEAYWKQFAAEVPDAEAVRAEHTQPTTRSVTKIERLPQAPHEPFERVTEVIL